VSTGIEWTDETWNPVRARLRSDPSRVGWHCEHASPGCINCYSETRNLSGRCNLGTKLPFKPGHRKDVEIFLDERALTKPLHWRKPRMIFVGSMTDLFADFVTYEMIDRVFAVMALCPQHTFQVLTKRSARMREYVGAESVRERIALEVLRLHKGRTPPPTVYSGAIANGDRVRPWPLPNVWLGLSVEDQARADERIPDLLATPAAVRWLSCEPLLGPVDLTANRSHYQGEDRPLLRCDALTGIHSCGPGVGYEGDKLNWIVCGGESGKGARPMHPAWARSLRDQCADAGVPFFFKQWGEHAPGEIAGDYLNPERTAKGLSYFDGSWGEAWSHPDGHRDDEPDVYRIGKKRAGRRLDGQQHDAMPEPARG
jgi:protein gp37